MHMMNTIAVVVPLRCFFQSNRHNLNGTVAHTCLRYDAMRKLAHLFGLTAQERHFQTIVMV